MSKTAVRELEHGDYTITIHLDEYPLNPVEEYDNYSEDELQAYHDGEAYGYVISDSLGNHIDSCWGYYGDAGLKYCIEQAKANCPDDARIGTYAI